MTKIVSIYLHALRNDEHFQFAQFVLSLVKEVGAAALKVEAQNTVLAAAHAREDEALKKINRSALTVAINDADGERDSVFRGFMNAVRAAEQHFDATVRAAAARFAIVTETYGDVTRKSHVEETSALYNLLKEIVTKHEADMEKLELGRWVAELDRLNRAVEKLLEGRADEGASRTSLVLREVRAEVDAAYAALAAMVEAQAMVAPATDTAAAALYDGFVRRLNERVDLLNHAVAQRRGIAKAKKEHAADPAPGDGGKADGK